MSIIPIKFGEIPLKSTRANFYNALEDLTENDYPLVPMIIAGTANLKDYAREMYDNTFMLFKIQKSGMMYSFLFTTIHCRLTERDSITTLKYHIRLNLFSNFLVLTTWCATLYSLYDSIFVSREFSFKIWIIIAISHLVYTWIFRSASNDDYDFLVKLVNHHPQSHRFS